MIVVALLVAGCLPKGQYAHQYAGPDAAKIIIYGNYIGVFILDGNAVDVGDGVLRVQPGKHELAYNRSGVMSMPYTRAYDAGRTYYFDMGMSWNGDYFVELTPEEYARKAANDSYKRAHKD
jgi:hypothetical protein